MGSANGKAAAIKIIDRPGQYGQGGAFVMETSCVSVLLFSLLRYVSCKLYFSLIFLFLLL